MKLRKTNVRTGGGSTSINNGFTLIELLAVIVILAIIAVIAVPIVLNIIRDTKEKSYDISVENIMRSAKIYDLESELNDTTILMDQNIYEDLKKNLNGSVPDDGVVYLKSSITGEKREIAFALQYGEWCYTKAYGDPTYEKKKTDICNVPFDYLFADTNLKSIDSTTGPENLFLWRSGIGDETKAIKRNQIESIEIKPSDKVSENAIYSWDVSENKTGKVMAWYEDIDKNGYFEVYIGQNGGVKAKDSARHLFAYLPNAININLKYFDTSQVTDMYALFNGCNNLLTLDISNFDTSKVGTNKKNSGSMSYMFQNCSKLSHLDISSFNTENVKSMVAMFGWCSSLINLDLSSFDTSKVTSMNSMFRNCSQLVKLNLGNNFKTGSVTGSGFERMFQYCLKLESLDVSSWDTSEATTMYKIFEKCISLQNLDVSNWDISSVTNISSMFYGCSSLKKLDVSKWDTSSVTTMNSMFCGCSSLTKLDVSKWDTSGVKNDGMSIIFNGCSSLIKLDLNKWDTSDVTSMERMFSGCSNLNSLQVSGFNTSKVTNMNSMFDGVKLTILDLSGWDTSSVTTMDSMFRRTSNLTTIKIGCGWKTAENTTNIFSASKYTLEQLNSLVEQTQATCPTS